MGGYQRTLRYGASIFRVELKMDAHLLPQLPTCSNPRNITRHYPIDKTNLQRFPDIIYRQISNDYCHCLAYYDM
jgi:hypothetical protein